MGFNGSHNRGESLQKQEEKIYYFGKAKIYTNIEKKKKYLNIVLYLSEDKRNTSIVLVIW